MEKIKFDPSELVSRGEYPSFMLDGKGPTVFSSPVIPRENFRAFIRGEDPLWMVAYPESCMFTPRILPDNIARGMVEDAEPKEGLVFGGRDMFGVEWEFYDSGRRRNGKARKP